MARLGQRMQEKQLAFFAVHGFLGEGADWIPLKDELRKILPSFDFYAPSLFSKGNSFNFESFEALSESIQNYLQTMSFNNQSVKKVYIGYSLGGRIGLHLLESGLFDHFVFISTHCGLDDVEDQKNRIESDKLWADRVKQLGWDNFLEQWLNQDVLAKSTKVLRQEVHFDRNKLRQALLNLSLGRQANKESIIQKYQNQITWLVGDKDQKFLDLGNELVQKKILPKIGRISNSGHRVVFDQPSQLAKFISELLFQMS